MATKNGVSFETVSDVESGNAVMDKFLAVADINSVYSEPLAVGEAVVIQAAEVFAAGGFGYGSGDSIKKEGDDDAQLSGQGAGSGGGGGGYFTGRPVAAIIIEKDKPVRVEPIFDVTKVTLALFTMLGSVAFMLARMRKV